MTAPKFLPRILRAKTPFFLLMRSAHFPVVVLGGGSAGCSMAARMCRMLGNMNVAVVEPAKYHVYQPLFTLVGAGIKTVSQSERPMSKVLPSQCVHYPYKVTEFHPENNLVILNNGEILRYKYLIVALGIQMNYNKVDGLLEALQHDPMVCSNYWRNTVGKTFPAIQTFKGGNAIFTHPNTPIKCAGASQKVMYLAEDYWRKNGIRSKTDITFKTSLGKIFLVKKYANELLKVAKKRGIYVDYRKNLVSIDHTKREASFINLDSEHGESETVKYDFIHVAPPMSAPDVLKNSKSPIVDEAGYLDVNKDCLQHKKYPNIFGIGDCSNLPTSKTVAAISGQSKVLTRTIREVMHGKKPTGKYDGYTSCPLLTTYNKCILAEFDYNGEPLETLPINQGKERRVGFLLKELVMPELYWKGLVNGYWNGPTQIRKMLHLWMSK